jgi:membrane protein
VSAGYRPVVRRLLRGLSPRFPDSDLALWAAGATFFGVLGLVPIVLVSLRLAAALVGPAAVTSGMAALASGLPAGHGTPQALAVLTSTAVGMSAVETLVVLFPASLYGEGLRRAFHQLAPQRPDALTGWRGRLALLPVVAAAPVLVLAALAAARMISPLYAAGGTDLLLGIVLGFHLSWMLVSVALVLVYRLVAAGRVAPRALLLGGFGTGAVVAGFLQGFVLFLAIPVEWAAPFAGLPVVGAVAALVLWLYLVHVLVLLGYRLTRSLGGGEGP